MPSGYLLKVGDSRPLPGTFIISYVLPRRSFVSLDVADACGNRIREIVSGVQEPGEYDVCWEGTDDNGETLNGTTCYCRLIARSADGGVSIQSCTIRVEGVPDVSTDVDRFEAQP